MIIIVMCPVTWFRRTQLFADLHRWCSGPFFSGDGNPPCHRLKLSNIISLRFHLPHLPLIIPIVSTFQNVVSSLYGRRTTTFVFFLKLWIMFYFKVGLSGLFVIIYSGFPEYLYHSFYKSHLRCPHALPNLLANIPRFIPYNRTGSM